MNLIVVDTYTRDCIKITEETRSETKYGKEGTKSKCFSKSGNSKYFLVD